MVLLKQLGSGPRKVKGVGPRLVTQPNEHGHDHLRTKYETTGSQTRYKTIQHTISPTTGNTITTTVPPTLFPGVSKRMVSDYGVTRMVTRERVLVGEGKAFSYG